MSKRTLEILDKMPDIVDAIRDGYYFKYTFPNTTEAINVEILYNEDYLSKLKDYVIEFFGDSEYEINEESITDFKMYYEAHYFALYNYEVIGQIIDFIVTHERDKLLIIGTN